MPLEPPAPQQKFSRYRSVRRAARSTHDAQPPIPASASHDVTSHVNVPVNYKTSALDARENNGSCRSVHAHAHSFSSMQQSYTANREMLDEEHTIESGRRGVFQDLEPRDHFKNSSPYDMEVTTRQDVQNQIRSKAYQQSRQGRERRQINNRYIAQDEGQNRGRQAEVASGVSKSYRSRSHQAEMLVTDHSHANRSSPDAAEMPADSNKGTRNPFSYFSRKRSLIESMPRSDSVPIGMPDRPAVSQSLNNQTQHGHVSRVQSLTDEPNKERRAVTVRYREMTVNLQVMASTTPIDLIRHTADAMEQHISPATTVAIEFYAKLGLERTIRPSEDILDVIDSWGHNSQSSIILQPFTSTDIHMQTPFLAEVPLPMSVNMYHSQEPGKWNKKHLHLRDGYISCTTSTKVHGFTQQSVNLCHLSEFDIYTINPTYQKRTLEPPRQYCYAIKSQHRLSTYTHDTSEFVHFFCTSDQMIAEEWYKAVQRWRSWYLQSKRPSDCGRHVSAVDDSDTSTRVSHGSRSRQKPEMATDIRRNRSLSSQRIPRGESWRQTADDSEEENRPRQIPLRLKMAHEDAPPPYEQVVASSSQPYSQLQDKPSTRSYGEAVSSTDSEGETFAQTGLLGRTYTQRQNALNRQNRCPSSSDGPFTSATGLLAIAYSQRKVHAEDRPSTSGGRSITQSPLAKDNSTHVVTPSLKKSDVSMRPGSSSSSGRQQGTASRPPTSVVTSQQPVSSGISRSRSVARPRTASSHISGMQRSISTRRREEPERPPGLPTPLLDFEEVGKFVEAPQWRHRSTGRGVVAPTGVLLVDAACNPEIPGIEMPKRGVFRREG